MKYLTYHLSAVLLCALLPALRAQDPSAAAAKKIFDEHQDAVVWVSVVAKIRFNTEGSGDMPINIPEREQKAESLATVIDPSGLVVTALSNIDPARDFSGREIRGVKIDANSTMKEVRITLPDGTDVPAEMIMRDTDLDLAFIRAKAGSKELKGISFKAVDLKKSGKAGVTDDAITLSRTDEVLSRTPSVTRGQIMTVTKKPREFFRATGTSPGCPTFAADGGIIGITVNRSQRGRGSHNVIVPAADVLEIAEQARHAKAPVPAPAKAE